DHVLSARRRYLVERVVRFDPVLLPAQRVGKPGGHVRLLPGLPMVMQPEDHQSVLLDELFLRPIYWIVRSEAQRSPPVRTRRRRRWRTVLPPEESRLIGEDQVAAGFRGALQDVHGGHRRRGDALYGRIRVTRLEAVGSGCGPVTAKRRLQPLSDRLSRQRA